MRIRITETVGVLETTFEAEADTQEETLALLEAARLRWRTETSAHLQGQLNHLTYLDVSVPAELAHLNKIEACGDCPIGGREGGPLCGRVELCDWECWIQTDHLNQHG